MTEKEGGYKKTFGDRFGPDGIFAKGAMPRLIPYALAAVIPLYVFLRVFTGKTVSTYLITFFILSLVFSAIFIRLSNRAGNGFGRVLVPRGKASPYQDDFSFEKTLVMQNRIAEALESYEERIRAYPNDTQTILEAAELNATKGSMARAVELFRSVRQLPDASQSHRINATNRLIDAYTRGSEANEEKVQKELRYLIASFPDTQAAAYARNILERQKGG